AFLSVTETANGSIKLRLGGFYDKDSDGQFEAFLNDASTAIAKAPEATVILDLRGNPGGIDGYGVATIQLLSSKAFTVYDEITTTADFDVDYVQTEIRADGVKVVRGADGLSETPAPKVTHKGPLILLVDQRTGSTATDVASHLDAFEEAIIIGQETTGAYNANSSGYLDLFTLKNSGAQLYLPQWRYTTSATSSARVHRGVLPDIPFYPVPSDLLSEEDRMMETALILAGTLRDEP
ncbi:MAG: S41 family peptidase, partial [Pseudomonadota bacterium]